MNSRNTWRWIVVAAGLFAFIFFYQRHVNKIGRWTGQSPAQPESGGGHQRAGPAWSAHLEIRADRTNGVWQLSRSRWSIPPRPSASRSLLAELERLTPATYITARELRDRPKADEEYGFAAPQASIIIEQPGYTARLRVGARTAPGDQVFLQVVGVEGVYVVDADFLKYIPTHRRRLARHGAA